MLQLLGQIALFPYTYEPRGWMFCDGRILSIANNDTLFTLLGTTFGGDGMETFALPDLQALAPRECHYCIAVEGIFKESYHQGLVGETMISARPDNPENLVECAGQTLPTAKYMLLQAYMGTRFGGDASNFKMPDLRDKSPANCHYMMIVKGDDPNSPKRDAFVGELILLPFDVTSSESLRLCNGELLPSKQYTALFSLLGTRFGGDEKQFALPDLRAAAPPKFNYYISLQIVFPSRG